MSSQLITLLNEAEYISSVIFLENYLNGISQKAKNNNEKKCENIYIIV